MEWHFVFVKARENDPRDRVFGAERRRRLPHLFSPQPPARPQLSRRSLEFALWQQRSVSCDTEMRLHLLRCCCPLTLLACRMAHAANTLVCLLVFPPH
jgi:hypothetical protein